MTNKYDIGDVIRFTNSVTNAAGVLTNATVAATARHIMTGTDTTLSVVNDSTGVYHADFTPTVDGNVVVRWTASGGVVGVEKEMVHVRRSWEVP